MLIRLVLVGFVISNLCGCEMILAAAVIADVTDGQTSNAGNDVWGDSGGGGGGYYYSNLIPARDGYMNGRIASVTVDSPTDVLDASGGRGWLDVYSEVGRANGGAIMTSLSFYGDENDLDPEAGRFAITDAGASVVGCSGPESGSWVNEGSLEDIEVQTTETTIIDEAGDEIPATQVDYQADFSDWGGTPYGVSGTFTLAQP